MVRGGSAGRGLSAGAAYREGDGSVRAGRHPGRGRRLRSRSPGVRPRRLLRRAAARRVRPSRRRGPGVPRLHRRWDARGEPARCPRRAAARPGARQPALEQPVVARHDRARRGSAPGRAVVLPRLARRVPVRVHPERERRPAAGGRGVPLRARRHVRADVRQPQLRQRHPRVRPPGRREDRLRAGRRARSAPRPRRDERHAAGRGSGGEQPAGVPGAVQLLRCPAPPDAGRRGARRRLGRPRRRGCVRADEPLRRRRRPPRLRLVLLLQDDGVPDGRRLPAGAPGPRGHDDPSMVRRRHDHDRLRPGRRALPPRRRGGVRGRHDRLPQPARRHHRPPPPRGHRTRPHPRPRRRASPRGCSARSAGCATATAGRSSGSSARPTRRLAAAPSRS